MQISVSCRAKSRHPVNLSLGFAPGFLDFARNDAREIGAYALPAYLVKSAWNAGSLRIGSHAGLTLRFCKVTPVARLNNPSSSSIARALSPRIV